MNLLQVIVRTPVGEVIKTDAHSVRVSTETGQVGLRPKMERLILAVEPGLMLVHRTDSTLFVGAAGGLVTCDGHVARLLTPLAVSGTDEPTVMAELTKQLQQPSAELEVRKTINNIQSNILNELKEDRCRRYRQAEIV